MNLRHYFKSLHCHQCGRMLRCECGYTLAIIGIAVAVVAAGYSAYSASEAQAQQNAMAKKTAQMNAEAERDAGTARANQIAYDAKKKQRSFLSRGAAAGVDVNESGSLLESETQFAADENYSEQLAKYPHELAGASDDYKADLFGFGEKQAKNSKYMNTGIAAGTTLATGAAKAYAGMNTAKGTTLDVG